MVSRMVRTAQAFMPILAVALLASQTGGPGSKKT